MELYEIVKCKEEKHTPRIGVFQEQVLTVVTDRDLAEQMLEIYESNQKSDEKYKINTVRKSEPQPNTLVPVGCFTCNSCGKCMNTIATRPNEMIRCIRFGELRQYILGKEN